MSALKTLMSNNEYNGVLALILIQKLFLPCNNSSKSNNYPVVFKNNSISYSNKPAFAH